MGFYYYQAYENPLKAIMGIAGLTIDAICTDEASRTLVKQLWKAHKLVEKKMEDDRIKADKQRDEEFLKVWYDSVKETAYFIKEQPRGVMKSMREEVEKFFRG